MPRRRRLVKGPRHVYGGKFVTGDEVYIDSLRKHGVVVADCGPRELAVRVDGVDHCVPRNKTKLRMASVR